MADEHPPVIDSQASGPLVLCTLRELAATGCREFRLGGGDWPLRGFVVRAGSEVRAYVNRCPHQLFRMNALPDDLLTADRRYILCEMHDALFEKESGLCIAGPCLGRSLWTLPIRIDAERVLLAPDADVPALIARFT
ncbi:MAG TPA: Rieske 2Fe-2S domain-containing protein [Steroidobacteraceae bacterium]|jgi:nitrite reductase/ring-hydroxylating ferredoxin subunit|nr:Rieske 2Fe-2S domain-containing protein [Steroidobacteraceae bacterium]